MPENVVYTIEMRGKDSGGVSVMEHITQAMAKAGAELNRLIAAAGGLDKAVKMSVTQPVVDDKDNQIGSVRASAQDNSASVDRAKVNSLQIIERGLRQVAMWQKELEDLEKKGASTSSKSSSEKISKLDQLGREIKQEIQLQKDLEQAEKKEAKSAVQAARERIAPLDIAKRQANQLLALQRELEQQQKKDEAASERAARKIKKAADQQKKAIDDVTKAEERKAKAIEASASRAERSFDRMVNGLNRMVNGLRQISQGFMEMGFILSTFVTGPLTLLLKNGFTDAVNFETAMARVRKAVDGMDDRSFEKLENRIRNLAKITPTTQEELAGIAEEVGQLGVTGEGVYRMVNLVNKVVIGTGVSAQGLATDFGRVAAALGIDLNTEQGMRQLEGIASVMDYVAKKTSTDMDGIMAAVKDAAVIGGILKKTLKPEELIAGLGVLITSGVDPTAAGTVMQRFFVQVMKNADQFASFMTGFERQVKDKNGNIVDSFQPYSDANDVIQAINDDPIQVLTDTVVALNTATDENKAKAIKKFMDAVGFVGGRLGAMGANADDLQEILVGVNEEMAHAITLQLDYERMLQTTDSAMKIFKNNVRDLGITIGSYVMPYINKAIQIAIPLIQDLGEAFNGLTEKQKMMVVVIPLMVAVLGPLLFLLSSLTHSIFLMGSGIVSVFMGAGAWIFRFASWMRKLGGMKGLLAPLGKVFGTVAKGTAAAGQAGTAATGIFARLGGVIVRFGGSIIGIPAAILGSLKVLTLFGLNIEKYFVELADRARVWGHNMMVTYGNGMLGGAAKAVSKAISTIAGWIARFFEAHSPPEEGPLSTIDQWGSAVMNTYLKGFLEADFDILSEVGNRIERAFEIFASLNNLELGSLNTTFMAFRENIAKVIDTFNKTGQVAEDVLSQIGTNLGTLGTDIQELIRLWLKYKSLQEKLAQLENRKKSTLKTYDAEIAKISKMNITAEEKAELIRQAQMNRDDELRQIEQEKKETEEQAEAAKEKLDWQKEYIDAQLEFLEMLKKEKESKSGGGGEEELDPIDFETPEGVGVGGDPVLDMGEEENLWSKKIEEGRAELDKLKTQLKSWWDESIFGKVFTAFDTFGQKTDTLKEKLAGFKDNPFIQTIQEMFDAMWANVDIFGPLTGAFDALDGALTRLGDAIGVSDLDWKKVLGTLGIIVGFILTVVIGTIMLVITTLINVVATVVEYLAKIIANLIDAGTNIMESSRMIWEGLWEFLVGIFTGNIEKIMDGWNKFWTGLLGIAAAWIQMILGTVLRVLEFLVVGVSRILRDLFAFIVQIFKGQEAANEFRAWVNGQVAEIQTMFDRFMGAFNTFKDTLRGWYDTIKGWLADLFNVDLNISGNVTANGSSTSPNYRAAGGITLKGKPELAWIGEGGEQEAIIPLSKLPGLMEQMYGTQQASSTGGIILNINNPVVREEQDIDRIADAVSRKLGKRTLNSSRIS